MNSHRRLSSALGLCAASAWLLATGCVRAPKYSSYTSPFGDFECNAPTGWSVVLDSSGKDYYQVLFTGPFETSFFHGVPSLSVRWYRTNAPRQLPNGNYEMFSSYRDFMNQIRRDVYGPDGYFMGGADQEVDSALREGAVLPEEQRVKVPDDKHAKPQEKQLSGIYFVAFHNALPVDKSHDGVVSNDQGERIVQERHGYVIVPVRDGFYVITYPATRQGFDKFRGAFFEMINSFRLLRGGPA